MATYDMTLGATLGGETANTTADLPDVRRHAYMVEALLDISEIPNYTQADGDVFQLLEVPAGTLILEAGVEVLTAFDGTAPTVDVDLAAGADIIDGGDVSSTGYIDGAGLAGVVTADDTIDVKLIDTNEDNTEGKLRVFAVVCHVDGVAETADEVVRDQLA